MSPGGMGWLPISFRIGGVLRAKAFWLCRRIFWRPCRLARTRLLSRPFVPLAITVERAVIADAPVSLETVEVSTGLITLEIGADIVLRVHPCYQSYLTHPGQFVVDDVAQEGAGIPHGYQIAGHIIIHAITLSGQFPRQYIGFAPHPSAQRELDHTVFCGKPRDLPLPVEDITPPKKMKMCPHDGPLVRRMAVVIGPDV
jgi:hypothetical protein